MSVPSLLSIFGNSGGEDKVYVDDVFSTYLWTGTGNTNLAINNGIDLAGEGGLVWLKQRTSAGEQHTLIDTERGQTKVLMTNNNFGNFTSGATQDLTSFNSNGFSLGPNFNYVKNNLTKDNVSWTFRKAPGFFDVVTYTGNGVAGRTISHSLGSVPGMIVIKRTNASEDWIVGHRSIGLGTGRLMLNDNTGNSNNNATQYWNSTAATSSQFTVGSHVAVNGDGSTYVAYLFAHDEAVFGTDGDESIIKCGITPTISQFGNANIELGFEPQFLLVKAVDISGSWVMLDVMRGIGTSVNNPPAILNPNSASSEGTSSDAAAIFSTGYSQKEYSSGNTRYIYMAIRRPHKPPEAGTEVFAVDSRNSTSPVAKPAFKSPFPADLGFAKWGGPENGLEWHISTRLTSERVIVSNSTAAETGASYETWDWQNGYYSEGGVYSTDYGWMFKRAPGFLDIVAYTGTGSPHTINHNLTVPPELMIVKSRSYADAWHVYSSALGNTKYINLNVDTKDGTLAVWNNTTPTSSVFSVGSRGETNTNNATYINFLFATLPGISKVGSYSGTGNAVNVDCGFTNGARFILIKRTDSTGDWYIWDTLRGIVSGNDPYLLLNSSNGQISNTDYVDPLTSGFTVTASAPAALNASGGTYIFLAIA